jgi:hypothetical protein
MNTFPRLASVLLQGFGVDPALIGDLEEASRMGRSRTWYWRQVAGILLFGSFRQGISNPLYTARALLIGWSTLLITFALFDLAVAPLGRTGYQTGQWMPFWVAAFLIAYTGFAFSAWVVARLHRRTAGQLLILHTWTVVFTMAVSALIVEMRAPAPTAVPHVLFPLVSVALPYQWRSGFVLVPATMLLTGMLVLRKAHHGYRAC